MLLDIESVIKSLSVTAGSLLAGGILGAFYTVKSFIKKWKEKSKAEKLKESLIAGHTKSNDDQIAVQNIICEIRGFTDAGRVGLFRYSNGTKTFNGDCLRNITCTAERTAAGVAPVILQFQQTPITPDIAILLDKIDKSPDGCLVINTKDLEGAQKVLQDSYGLTKSYNFKLGKSVWEGVLSIVYLNGDYDLDKEQIHKINVCIKQINDYKNQ